MGLRIKDQLAQAIAIGSLLLAGAVSAQTLEIKETAHELALGDITLPGSTAGTLVFRSCAECDPVALPVNASTAYIGAQGAMALADFTAWVGDLRRTPGANDSTFVTVFRDAQSGKVTRIQVHAED